MPFPEFNFHASQYAEVVGNTETDPDVVDRIYRDYFMSCLIHDAREAASLLLSDTRNNTKDVFAALSVFESAIMAIGNQPLGIETQGSFHYSAAVCERAWPGRGKASAGRNAL